MNIIGSVLSCTPHIVENIFQHLTAKDLCSCASVCSLWSALSQAEIKRRRTIIPFFQGIKCGRHRVIHRNHGTCSCSMRQAPKFEKELKTQLESIETKPAFCIAFATTAFLEHFEQLFPSYFSSKRPRKMRKRCYWDYFDTAVKIALRKHLPKACIISLYIEKEIIIYGGVTNLIYTEAPALCGYLFPKFPNGELNFYSRKEHTGGKILKNIIRNGHNIKSTLNLIEYSAMPYFQIALNELRHKHNAFERGVIMPVEMASNFVPVFEGPNVETFRFSSGSYISSQQGNSLHTIMRQWKNQMKEQDKDNTIAFMFSIDHVYCYEVCEIFKMVYPDIPLIGMVKYTSTSLENLHLGGDSNFINRSIVESGLQYNCVFIFVIFA